MSPLPTRNSQLALRRADFRAVPEMLDYAAQGETGVTFYSVRGEPCRPDLARHPRPRPCRGPPPDRRGICPRRANSCYRRHLAGLLRQLLRRPVRRPCCRCRSRSLSDRRQDAYLDQLKRQLAASGAVAAVGVDDLGGLPGRRRPRLPGRPPAWRRVRHRSAAGKTGQSPPAGAGRSLLHPVLLGSTRQPHGVQITQAL